jgi:predicted RND superfamily exporter protein
MELNEAKRAYKEAYEAGDTDKIIEAQQKLTEVSLKNDKVKNYRPTPLQTDEPELQIKQQMSQPRPDPAAVAWQKQNSWFGDDEEMTSLALGLHEKLKKEGVAVSSQEYYRRIDETIRKRFPERFETDTEEIEDKEESAPPTRKPSTVVAPATRSTSPKKIRLTNSQLSIAKKLGLSPEQYAQAVLKMES